ncbi:Gfo/Idh/MocA family oxidoreductase [Vibrio sp.]|uniref:Inositol 2-dehydrogenase n=1 Tax=Vibrio viridaestus TaxID=2487322 RepID=A0A3N9TEP2_9VIBR|nr:Gfo/Idh/MocA family oxidoreductase [Vibrio viridaestus]MDC0611417.1 Gfo/Idh/MocA family oxidoreductase [Vibrio sp.]RQW62708.1 gfo/Idh/MocA family oxidoreductase [Vibrio viridaestus]
MTLRVGVVGVGGIGKEHVKRVNYLTGAHVTAVSDVNNDQVREWLAKENIEAEVFDNGVDLINSDIVDAVVVASWGPTHEEFVLAAIAAGKYVFCEKPLAVTEEGCRKIVDAEIAAGKKLVQVGFMRRYDKSYRQLKAVLDQKVIGEPLTLNAWHHAPEAPGFKGDMAITDSIVHEADVLRWLLEEDWASAQVILPKKTSISSEPELQDPHVVLLRTKSGVHVSVQSFVFCQYGYDIQCQITGEKGVAALPDPATTVVRTAAKLEKEIFVDWKDRFFDAFDTEFQEWIDSVHADKLVGPTAWDGYCVAVTIDACVKAKYSGQIEPIAIPETPAFYK